MARYFHKFFIVTILLIMGKIIVPEIRENFSLYTSLVKDRKGILEKLINISKEKKSNKNYLITDDIDIRHIKLENQIFFFAEVKVNNHKYFLFKLKCNDLCQVPFFRYDSDGASHRNYDNNIPLEKQVITTPHFNAFNEDGLSIAYKTPQLENEKEKAALEDINLCISHFCHESNVRLNDDEFPGIAISDGTLALTLTKDDPNSGVDFI